MKTATNPAFPKGMSTKRAERWLAANNPFPPGTYEAHRFAARFWGDQSDKDRRKALRCLIVAAGCMAGSLAAQIVAAVTP